MRTKFKISVSAKRCKLCGICSQLCPEHVFDQELGCIPVPVRMEDCIGCKLCVIRCPDFALDVEVQS